MRIVLRFVQNKIWDTHISMSSTSSQHFFLNGMHCWHAPFCSDNTTACCIWALQYCKFNSKARQDIIQIIPFLQFIDDLPHTFTKPNTFIILSVFRSLETFQIINRVWGYNIPLPAVLTLLKVIWDALNELFQIAYWMGKREQDHIHCSHDCKTIDLQ